MYDDFDQPKKPFPYVQMFLGLFAVIFSCSISLPVGSWLSRALATDSQRSQMMVRQAEMHRNLMLLQDVAAWTGIVLMVGLAGGIIAFVSVKVSRQKSLVRAVNGVFPIERRQVGNGLWDRIRRANRRRRGLTYAPVRQIVIDHNLAPGHIRSYVLTEDGMVFQTSPDWDDERNRLTAVNMARQANNIQALGAGNGFGRPTAGAMRAMLEPKPPKPTGYELPQDDLPALPMLPRLTAEDALRQSGDGQIILGQNKETGALAVWDSDAAQQVAVFGANKTGKTSSAASMIVTVFVWNGVHVIALDLKGGVDWGVFEKWIERHDSDPECMGEQLQAVVAEMKRRGELCKLHNVPNVDALPDNVRPQPWALILEELGDVRSQAKALGILSSIDGPLDTLMSVSRYTGLRIVLIDQRPQDWPARVKANTKEMLTFRQGMGQGAAVGYYHAHTLAQQGEFAMNGERYNAFHVLPKVHKLLANVPAMTAPRLIPPVAHGFGRLAGDDGGPVLDLTLTQPDPVDESLRWDEVVDAWFAAHPEALEGEPNGINDLARAIATADGFAPDPSHPRDWPINWRAKQSVASDYYHRRRAAYHAGEWMLAGAGAPSNDGEEAQGQAVEVAPLDLSERTTGSLLNRLEEVELSGEEGRKIWAELNRRKVPGFPVQQ